jgi:membrane protein YdbS with pleckstrin-like domain
VTRETGPDDADTEEKSGLDTDHAGHGAGSATGDDAVGDTDRPGGRGPGDAGNGEGPPVATRRPTPGDEDLTTQELPFELPGPEQGLEPEVRYVWLLRAAVSSFVVGSMVGLPAFLLFDRPVVAPAVFTVLFVVGAALAVFRYRSWRYQVQEDSLFLDRGVVTRTKTVVPYVRIQHVDASRGPVERALGLSTAVVYTAGSRGADVSIPGLTPERADELQDRLKRLAIAAEGEDAV